MRLDFYALSKSSLEDTLLKILDKVISSKKRALVFTQSEEKAETLCDYLWSANPNKWFGHGTVQDGNVSEHNIFISHQVNNLNNSDIIILTNSIYYEELFNFERCINIFAEDNIEAIDSAKKIWFKGAELDFELNYWSQTSTGQWIKKDFLQ
jgi:DNA polymerase-3 subunit chi